MQNIFAWILIWIFRLLFLGMIILLIILLIKLFAEILNKHKTPKKIKNERNGYNVKEKFNKNKIVIIGVAAILFIFIFSAISTTTSTNKNNDQSASLEVANQAKEQQASSDNITNANSPSFTKEPNNSISTPKPTAKPTPKQTKVKGSKLFEKVYVPFASREKGCTFSQIESYIKTGGYKYKIKKPTKKDYGEIKVSASNGDYVYFCFYSTDVLDGILLVSYTQKKTNKSVQLANYSSENNYHYDILTTEVFGKSPEEATSIKDQREFLFKK